MRDELIEKHGSAAEACKALGIYSLSSNPSTTSHAVIRPDYHAYTQPRYKNLPSPYKVNLRTRLKYAKNPVDWDGTPDLPPEEVGSLDYRQDRLNHNLLPVSQPS